MVEIVLVAAGTAIAIAIAIVVVGLVVLQRCCWMCSVDCMLTVEAVVVQ